MNTFFDYSAQPSVSVWLVEDHDKYRATVEHLIESTDGMQCTGAFESCEEALQHLNQAFVPEVILMDINLPGMNGIEGVAQIKARLPATQVIMLTNYEDQEQVYEAIRAGASGYLLKTSSSDIIDAIEQVRQGGAPMSPRVAHKVLNMFKHLTTPAWDYGLSARELEVLERLAEGLTKAQIGDRLFISAETVASHTKNVYDKLHVNSAPAAVAKAIRERLI